MIWNSYRLLFTPLSPIHIGTGVSYEPTNYVIEDHTLHEFDTDAILNTLMEQDRQELLALGNRRPDAGMLLGIQKFFYERRERLIPWATHRIPVLNGVADFYASKVGKVAQREGQGRVIINKLEIDRTAYNPVTHRPVLPGSSVKGAIRTALLDSVNRGRPTQERDGLHPFQGRLFRYREPEQGRLFLERDPMRLIQLADAIWQEKNGLPVANVFLAVNRKKDLVTDKQGTPRQSQAEANQLYQILECVPPLRYQAFSAQLNVQGLGEAAGRGGGPAPEMRFTMEQIAQACNAFYRPLFETELSLLAQHGYLNTEWHQTITKVLKMISQDQNSVFLLRVGRHSGAESVTLNGVRRIKIMKGPRRPPDYGPSAKTVWLAADEPSQTSGLLPFGWVLVEYENQEKVVPEQPTLQTICEAYSEPARVWAQTMQEKESRWEQIRHETGERQRAEAEQARRQAEEAARMAEEEAEQQAKRAAMSPQERALEETQRLFEDEAQRGVLKPGSLTVNNLNQLLKEADEWPPKARHQLAELAEKVFAHPSVGWGSREKKRERTARIQTLKNPFNEGMSGYHAQYAEE